jgi:hypothetical protein
MNGLLGHVHADGTAAPERVAVRGGLDGGRPLSGAFASECSVSDSNDGASALLAESGLVPGSHVRGLCRVGRPEPLYDRARRSAMPTPRTVFVLALLVGLALFLAACGGGGHGGY